MDIVGTIDFPRLGVPTDSGLIIELIKTVLRIVYGFAGVAAVGFIIYSGFSIMSSAGDPQKLKKAQDSLAYSIVGLIVIIISGVILQFVADMFGVADLLLNLQIP